MTNATEKQKSPFVHVCRYAATGKCRKTNCYHYTDHLIEPECKSKCPDKPYEPRCLTIRTGAKNVEL